MISVLLPVYGVAAAGLGSYNVSKFLVRRAIKARRRIISDAQAKVVLAEIRDRLEAAVEAVEDGKSISEDVRGAVEALKGE